MRTLQRPCTGGVRRELSCPVGGVLQGGAGGKRLEDSLPTPPTRTQEPRRRSGLQRQNQRPHPSSHVNMGGRAGSEHPGHTTTLITTHTVATFYQTAFAVLSLVSYVFWVWSLCFPSVYISVSQFISVLNLFCVSSLLFFVSAVVEKQFDLYLCGCFVSLQYFCVSSWLDLCHYVHTEGAETGYLKVQI